MRSSLLIGFLVASTACLSACSEETPPGGRTSSGPSASSSASEVQSDPGGSGALLYLDGKRLRSFDLHSGSKETLEKIPSTDAVAAPDGNSIAYVSAGVPGEEDEDFVSDPELHVLDVAAGVESTIGPGLSPIWHPDGQRLAYLEPEETRVCEGETCAGSASVVVADVADEQRRTVLEPGSWALLGWLGDGVVVSDQAGSPEALVVDEGRRPEALGIDASEFWGASPGGEWLVQVVRGESSFVPTDHPAKITRPLALDGRILAQGAWAPSGDRLAAVLLEENGAGSELGIFSIDGAAETVPGSVGAEGPVLWGPGSADLVYVRAAGRGSLRLEAVHCDVSGPPECASLFSWPRGIALLALTD